MREEQAVSLRDLLNVIYRRIWILKVVVILLPLSVLLACLVATPSFETKAKVVVTAKRDPASILSGATQTGPARIISLNIDEMDLNTEMEILYSLDLWTKTVEAMGPGFLQSGSPGLFSKAVGSLERATSELTGFQGPQESAENRAHSDLVRNRAKSLLSGFKVEPMPKSKVLDLSLHYSDANMVQKIMSVLLDQYIPYHLQVYSTPGVEVFFDEQVKSSKESYEQANIELTEFRKRWNLALPDRQKTEFIAMLKTLEDSLFDINSNLKQYADMNAIFKGGGMASGQLAPSMYRGGENTVINVMAVQLLQAEQKQLQVGQIFTADSRDYVSAAGLTSELGGKFQAVLDGELSILKAKKASLEQSRDALLDQMRVLLEKSEDARSLQLQETIAKERYLQMVAKAQEARFENLESRKELVDVKVLARPIVPMSPVFPKTALFVLAALLISFPLGIGMIFVANFMDYTFDSPEQLEKATGFRVLATLGKLKKGGPETT